MRDQQGTGRWRVLPTVALRHLAALSGPPLTSVKIAANIGLAVVVSVVMILGKRQHKSQSQIGCGALMAAMVYAAVILVWAFASSDVSWRWYVVAGASALGIGAAVLGWRLWQMAPETGIPDPAAAVDMDTVWLRQQSDDDPGWPGTTPIQQGIQIPTLLRTSGFLQPGERLFLESPGVMNGGPELGSCRLLVTDRRLLFAGQRSLFTIPRGRLRNIAFHRKRGLLFFTYATPDGDREINFMNMQLVLRNGLHTRTRELFDRLQTVLTQPATVTAPILVDRTPGAGWSLTVMSGVLTAILTGLTIVWFIGAISQAPVAAQYRKAPTCVSSASLPDCRRTTSATVLQVGTGQHGGQSAASWLLLRLPDATTLYADFFGRSWAKAFAPGQGVRIETWRGQVTLVGSTPTLDNPDSEERGHRFELDVFGGTAMLFLVVTGVSWWIARRRQRQFERALAAAA